MDMMTKTRLTNLAVTYPHLAAEWHPTRNGDRTPERTTYGSHYRAWWRHVTADGVTHEWESFVFNRSGNGSGCPICKRERGMVRATEPSTVTHPGVAAEWHPTRNGDLTADTVTAGSGRKVWWQHVTPDGFVHEWKARVANRTAGDGSWCPTCSRALRTHRWCALPERAA